MTMKNAGGSGGGDWFNAQGLYSGIRDALGLSLQDPIPVALGFEDEDGIQYIDVEAEDSDEPLKFYFHNLPGMQTRMGEAYATGPAPIAPEYLIYGMPIRIKQDPLSYGGSPRWLVDGLDTWLASEFLNGVDPDEAKRVKLERFDPGLLLPTKPASMQVRVKGAPYTYNGDWKWIYTQRSADFSDEPNDVDGNPITLPTGSNKSKMVLVQINFATGELTYKQGGIFNSSLSIDQAYEKDTATEPYSLFPNVDEGCFRAGFFRLQVGQTAINKNQIWTMQELYTKSDGEAAVESILSRIVVDDDGVVVDDNGVVWTD